MHSQQPRLGQKDFVTMLLISPENGGLSRMRGRSGGKGGGEVHRRYRSQPKALGEAQSWPSVRQFGGRQKPHFGLGFRVKLSRKPSKTHFLFCRRWFCLYSPRD